MGHALQRNPETYSDPRNASVLHTGTLTRSFTLRKNHSTFFFWKWWVCPSKTPRAPLLRLPRKTLRRNLRLRRSTRLCIFLCWGIYLDHTTLTLKKTKIWSLYLRYTHVPIFFKPFIFQRVTFKSTVVVYACVLNIWETMAGRSQVQSQPGLHSEFQNGQEYIERPHLKTNKQRSYQVNILWTYSSYWAHTPALP